MLAFSGDDKFEEGVLTSSSSRISAKLIELPLSILIDMAGGNVSGGSLALVFVDKVEL